MKTLSFILAFIFCVNCEAEDKGCIFQLLEIVERSSINSNLLHKLKITPNLNQSDLSKVHPYFEKVSARERIFQLFKPLKGINKTYKFRASYFGECITGEEKIFHESMILEVNSEGVITEGITYTEEWAEPPLTWDIYQVGVRGFDTSPTGYIDLVTESTPLNER